MGVCSFKIRNVDIKKFKEYKEKFEMNFNDIHL